MTKEKIEKEVLEEVAKKIYRVPEVITIEEAVGYLKEEGVLEAIDLTIQKIAKEIFEKIPVRDTKTKIIIENLKKEFELE